MTISVKSPYLYRPLVYHSHETPVAAKSLIHPIVRAVSNHVVAGKHHFSKWFGLRSPFAGTDLDYSAHILPSIYTRQLLVTAIVRSNPDADDEVWCSLYIPALGSAQARIAILPACMDNYLKETRLVFDLPTNYDGRDCVLRIWADDYRSVAGASCYDVARDGDPSLVVGGSPIGIGIVGYGADARTMIRGAVLKGSDLAALVNQQRLIIDQSRRMLWSEWGLNDDDYLSIIDMGSIDTAWRNVLDTNYTAWSVESPGWRWRPGAGYEGDARALVWVQTIINCEQANCQVRLTDGVYTSTPRNLTVGYTQIGHWFYVDLPANYQTDYSAKIDMQIRKTS